MIDPLMIWLTVDADIPAALAMAATASALVVLELSMMSLIAEPSLSPFVLISFLRSVSMNPLLSAIMISFSSQADCFDGSPIDHESRDLKGTIRQRLPHKERQPPIDRRHAMRRDAL